MLLYGNSCDLLVNLSIISLLCSNGNRYITVICVSLGNELELSVVDFINAQTFARHILPSLAVLVLNLLNSICVCTAYCNRCFCTSVCIVIEGNIYGKVLCFTGFHRGIVKVGNGNLGIYIFVYLKGLTVAAILNFMAFGILHNSSQGHGCIVGILGNSNTELHVAHVPNFKGIRHFLPLLRSAVVIFQLCVGAVVQFQGHSCSCVSVLLTSQGKLMLLASLNGSSFSINAVDFHAGG